MVALVMSIAVSRKLTEEVAAPADAAAYSLAAMAAAVVAGPPRGLYLHHQSHPTLVHCAPLHIPKSAS